MKKRYVIGCRLLPEAERDVSHAAPDIEDALDLYGQEQQLGSEAAFSVDLDEGWLEKFSRASNFLDATEIDPGRLGAAPEPELTELPDSGDAPILAPDGAGLMVHKFWQLGPVLDQGREGKCVAYSLCHFLNASPVKSSYGDEAADIIYREAQKIDEWPGECVDEETECLSKRGWLGPDELRAGDEILTLDLDNEGLRWKPVKMVHRYLSRPYRVWEHNQIKIAVTDNHKWVVGNRNTHAAYELVETVDLKSQHVVPRSIGSLLEQPEQPIYSDDFVKTVAWVSMEGYYRQDSRRGTGVGLTQKNYKHSVAALMERQGVAKGFEDKIGCHHWELSGELSKQIREVAPGKAPSMDWICSLTKRQLRIFVDTCCQADGSLTSGEKWSRLDRRSFHQKPGPILDAFLAACVLLGIAVSRANEVTENRSVETWSLRKSDHTEVRNMEPSAYMTGPVWCPETEAGTFIARRSGAIFVTGNSYSGTSVTAGLEVLYRMGYLNARRSTRKTDEMKRQLRDGGGIILSVPWFESDYRPGPDNYLNFTGRQVGRHAIFCFGVSRWDRWFLQNSWGPNYGKNGRVRVAPDTMDRVIQGDPHFQAQYATQLKK